MRWFLFVMSLALWSPVSSETVRYGPENRPGTCPGAGAITTYKVAVVMVKTSNYKNGTANAHVLDQYSPEDIGQRFFSHPRGVQSFLCQASAGRAALTGTVIGWLESWGSEVSADDMRDNKDEYIGLAAAEVNLTDFDIYVLVGRAASGAMNTGWTMQNSLVLPNGDRLNNRGFAFMVSPYTHTQSRTHIHTHTLKHTHTHR